jgi:hypothetical protein
MKVIEQAGLAYRRSRAAWAGSARNPAAWVAMNASRGCRRIRGDEPTPPG